MVGNVLRRTAEALKVSGASVCNPLKELRVQGVLSSPAKKGLNQTPALRSNGHNLLEGVIRRGAHRFYTSGELPTMDKLLWALRDEVEYPFGSTVRKMGFRYSTQTKKTALYEQHKSSLLDMST